jgi:organic radical activating enzyme
MSPSRAKLPSMSAALAGLPAGVQPRGPWMGRRQLFVRFASEAETASIFTADALRGELARLATRSQYHSIAIAGGDPLAEAEFLCVALKEAATLPVMLEHDGQRPEALDQLLGALRMVQVIVGGGEGDAALERIGDSLARAAARGVEHALVIEPADSASDAQLLRVVERVHAASTDTSIVLHPPGPSAGVPDRRWLVWLEKASAVHADVRLLPVATWRA